MSVSESLTKRFDPAVATVSSVSESLTKRFDPTVRTSSLKEYLQSLSVLSKSALASVSETLAIVSEPPPPPPPPPPPGPPPITITPSNETVNFQGYTTTILFRDPSYLLRYVKPEDLPRIILMSDVASVFNISNITLLVYQPDQSVAYFLTFAKDRVLTWIAFKENDIIYYINNFSVDPNSKRWIINNYLAIQVNQTVINALIAYFYYQEDLL